MWSLQSRDEGADKDGAKRWREKREKGECGARRDVKTGANDGGVKRG